MASSNELMDEWMAGFRSGQSSSGFLTTQREAGSKHSLVTHQGHECCQEGTWFLFIYRYQRLERISDRLEVKGREKGVGMRDAAATTC